MGTGVVELTDLDAIRFFLKRSPLSIVHAVSFPSKTLFSTELIRLLDKKKVTDFDLASASYTKLEAEFKTLRPGYDEYLIFAGGVCIRRFKKVQTTTKEPLLELLKMFADQEKYFREQRQRFEETALRAIRDAQAWLASRASSPPPPPPPRPPENSPFADLEIPETATYEQARAAHIRMVKEYHPDRVEAAGKKLKALALEETTKANKAFDQIKKRFGKG